MNLWPVQLHCILLYHLSFQAVWELDASLVLCLVSMVWVTVSFDFCSVFYLPFILFSIVFYFHRFIHLQRLWQTVLFFLFFFHAWMWFFSICRLHFIFCSHWFRTNQWIYSNSQASTYSKYSRYYENGIIPCSLFLGFNALRQRCTTRQAQNQMSQS